MQHGPKISQTINIKHTKYQIHVRKLMKFATKPVRNWPPHLRHVATLLWEIKNSYFLQIFSRYGRKTASHINSYASANSPLFPQPYHHETCAHKFSHLRLSVLF